MNLFYILFFLNLMPIGVNFKGLPFDVTPEYFKTNMICFFMLIYFFYRHNNLKLFPRSYAIYRSLLIFVSYCTVTIFWFPSDGLLIPFKWITKFWLVVLVIPFVMSAFREKQIDTFMRWFRWFSIIFLIISSISEIFLRDVLLPGYIGDPRFQGFAGVHPTKFVLLLILSLFYSKYLVYKDKTNILVILITLFLLILTLQRIAIVSGIVIMVLIYVLYAIHSHQARKAIYASLLGFLSIILAFGLFLFYEPLRQKMFFSQETADQVIEALKKGKIAEAYASINDQGRGDLWAIIKTKKPTIQGYGFGSTIYYTPEEIGQLSEMHNDYLKLLFEVGYLGIVAYFLFLYTYYRNAYIVLSKSSSRKQLFLILAAIGGVTILPLNGLFDNAIDHMHHYIICSFCFLIFSEKLRLQSCVKRETTSPIFRLERR